MRLKLPVTVGAEEKSRALYPFLLLALALGPSSFPSRTRCIPPNPSFSPPPCSTDLLFCHPISYSFSLFPSPATPRDLVPADEDAGQKSDRVQVQGQILRIFKRKLEFFYGMIGSFVDGRIVISRISYLLIGPSASCIVLRRSNGFIEQ